MGKEKKKGGHLALGLILQWCVEERNGALPGGKREGVEVPQTLYAPCVPVVFYQQTFRRSTTILGSSIPRCFRVMAVGLAWSKPGLSPGFVRVAMLEAPMCCI